MTKKLLEESTVDRWKELAGINESRWFRRYGSEAYVKPTGPANIIPDEQEKQQIEEIKDKMFDSLLPLMVRVASAWSSSAAKKMSNAKQKVLSKFPETEAFFTRQEQGKITMVDNAGFLFLRKFVEMSGLPFEQALGYAGDEESVRQEAKQVEMAVRGQL